MFTEIRDLLKTQQNQEKSLPESSPRVMLAVQRLEPLVRHVGVDLGGGDPRAPAASALPAGRRRG